MFNATRCLKKAFVKKLIKSYKSTYGGLNENYSEIIAWGGGIAVDIISNSDALYHNIEHTILVTLIGQTILKGKHIKEGGVSSNNWLNCVIGLLFHDIGYVRGICKDDDEENRLYATGRKKGELYHLPEELTDASLAFLHISRGKLFVQERFGNHSILNTELIKKSISLTPFPFNFDGSDSNSNSDSDSDSELGGENDDQTGHSDQFGLPQVVRAADLIAQIGDPNYLQRVPNLYYEFKEIGANERFGYKTPNDLIKSYPKMFWTSVYKYIKDAIVYLKMTTEGQGILASLFSNIFAMEHENVLKKTVSSLSIEQKKRMKIIPSPNDENRAKQHESIFKKANYEKKLLLARNTKPEKDEKRENIVKRLSIEIPKGKRSNSFYAVVEEVKKKKKNKKKSTALRRSSENIYSDLKAEKKNVKKNVKKSPSSLKPIVGIKKKKSPINKKVSNSNKRKSRELTIIGNIKSMMDDF